MPARNRARMPARRCPRPSGHDAAPHRAGLGADPPADHHRLFRGAAGFITGTDQDPRNTLAELEAIHRFTYAKLGDEYLWSPSMPCPLPSEADIPIAEYGSSTSGGSSMSIAGAWRCATARPCSASPASTTTSRCRRRWQPVLQADDSDTRSERDYRSARYIRLIRNFRRYSWLLMYLFGASPALDASFLRGRRISSKRSTPTPCTCPTPPACA